VTVDGHRGLSNEVIKERVISGKFELAFTYLKVQHQGGFFVVHATSRTWSLTVGLQPKEFLPLVGLTPTKVGCQLFGEDCFYRVTHENPPGVEFAFMHPENRPATIAHAAFDSFATSLGDLYTRTCEIYAILGENPDLFPWARGFNASPRKLDLAGVVPAWVDELKSDEHQAIEQQLPELTEADRRFRQVEYVLWGTGEELEDAVQLLLEDLGLNCSKTVKGATVDLLADYPSGELKFSFEVTGINDAIKKGTKKLGQALTRLGEKDDEERVVIVANAHNTIPINERSEAFTPELRKLLEQAGVVAVTTEQLYRVWLKRNESDPSEFLVRLHAHPGGVFRG
jgi:hypothetical protein